MHKEVKQGRKTVAIVISLITITIALYIHQFSKLAMDKNIGIKIFLEVAVAVITCLILFRETKRCKIAYKYSIISDKLIINKINRKIEENVESLKIKDIIYIGDICNAPKEYTKGKYSKHYIMDFEIKGKCVCIYKKQDRICKFVFKPSNTLIERVNSII